MANKNLAVLFAGTQAPCTLLDGRTGHVYVRALPERYLGHVLECAEHKHRLVELCTYFILPRKGRKKEAPADASLRIEGDPAHPEVVPPTGYRPVPYGWCDNVSDESLRELYEEAKRLNFSRAANWAKDQIVAKKLVAPLHEAAIAQTLPLVDQVMKPLVAKLERLFVSTQSSPSSSAAPENSS